MKQLRLLVIAILTFIPFSEVVAQSELQSEVEFTLEQLKDLGTPLNGSLVILNKDSILFETNQGYANFEHKVPNTSKTKFRLASLSKQFTAYLIIKLHEEGKIKLSERIGTYLDEFDEPKFDEIQVHHLLTHTSGLPSNPPYLWKYPISEFGWDFKKGVSTETFKNPEFAAELAQDELEFSPGSKTVYNNSAYVILGYLIERVSGYTFEEYLEQSITAPLNMSNTGVEHLEEFLEKRAYNYEYKDSGGVTPSYRFRNVYPIAPAGGLYSTPEDMMKWVKSIFINRDQLQEDSYNKLFTKRWDFNNYGYGFSISDFEVDSSETTPVVWHTGQISGVQNVVAYIPQKDIAIVSLSNIGFTFPVNAFIRALVKDVFEAEKPN